MSRYFFHIKHGGTVFADKEGICLHDLDAEVIRSLREVLNEPEFEDTVADGISLEIANESGAVVLTMSF